jgi:rhodanese-related sulfurtransferase
MKSLPGLLTEAVLVLVAGMLLAWAGNALSPRGLKVDRDYFPREVSPPPGGPAPSATGTSGAAGATGAASATGEPAVDAGGDAADPAQRAAIVRLQARGLVPMSFGEARATFEDPLCAAGAFLFLDARAEGEHALGHIPGAYVFDHYHLERYLAGIMALVPGAMRMVVYCSGGDCEDSEFAAATLAGLLPDPSILRVYVGGITEWERHGMPVETGARGSGALRGGGR